MRANPQLIKAIGLAASIGSGALGASAPGNVDWPSFNNDLASNRYSSLDQIGTANVAKLRIVCRADLDARPPFESGPTVADGFGRSTSTPSRPRPEL